MAILRVRARTRPGDESRDVNLGDHCDATRRQPFAAMRLPIDEAIAMSWAKGHPIGRRSS